MLCPLLFIANKSFKPQNDIRNQSIDCKGKECTWFDSEKETCKIINSIYEKEYIEKSFNFI